MMALCAPATFIRSLKNQAIPSAIAFSSAVVLIVLCIIDSGMMLSDKN